MKSQKKFPLSKFFRRLFFTNVLLFIIPVFLGIFMFSFSSQIIEDLTLNSHLSILEQTKSVVDGRLEEIENIAYQIASNPEVQKLRNIYNPLHYTAICSVLDTKKALNYYQLTNNFIFDYYIFYENSGLVISPNIACPVEVFFGNYIKYPGMSDSEFRGYLLKRYSAREYICLDDLIIHNIPHNIVAYKRSLPYEINSSGILIVFFINAQQIKNLLEFKFMQQRVPWHQKTWIKSKEKNSLIWLNPMA
jgi:two-component system response regulator YesN